MCYLAQQTNQDFLYKGDNVPDFDTNAVTEIISSNEVREYELSVEGKHNQFNAEFVYRIVTERFGCDEDAIREALSSFNGLAHRLQHVGNVDGVDYYDDSISTIPQATISAALSLKNAGTLLIGGMDRGIDYTVLEEFIPAHEEYNYICMYESGKRK